MLPRWINRAALTLGVVLLAVCAVFVWPTAYRYGTLVLATTNNYGGGNRLDVPYRINRLTGAVEVWRGEWRPFHNRLPGEP